MSCSIVSAEQQEEEEEGDEEAEKAFLQFYINVPAGPPLSQVLRDPEKRRKLGEFMCLYLVQIYSSGDTR